MLVRLVASCLFRWSLAQAIQLEALRLEVLRLGRQQPKENPVLPTSSSLRKLAETLSLLAGCANQYWYCQLWRLLSTRRFGGSRRGPSLATIKRWPYAHLLNLPSLAFIIMFVSRCISPITMFLAGVLCAGHPQTGVIKCHMGALFNRPFLSLMPDSWSET